MTDTPHNQSTDLPPDAGAHDQPHRKVQYEQSRNQSTVPWDIKIGERYTDAEGRTWELTEHGQWKEGGNQPTELPLVYDDIVERVAVAIEETMFAPHEFPLDRELHDKYRMTAREAIAVVRQWDAGK